MTEDRERSYVEKGPCTQPACNSRAGEEVLDLTPPAIKGSSRRSLLI